MKKADDEEKHKAETHDEGFQIPQGTVHQNKKKLEADELRKIVNHILDRELDPSGILVDEVKVRHELKPYGFNGDAISHSLRIKVTKIQL